MLALSIGQAHLMPICFERFVDLSLVEPHPLFRRSNTPVQIELFSCHMKKDLIHLYQEKKKEYRYVLRHIDRMDAQHRDIKRLKKLDAKEIYDENGFGALVIGPNGTKWVGSYSNGVIGFNENGNLIRQVKGEDTANLPINHIKALALDNNNVLWIGTVVMLCGFTVAIFRRFDEFVKMRDKGIE